MFVNRNRHSGLIAKDRLKLLLVSERLSCSPQMMTMLKNDMVQAAEKYFNVDKDKVEIRCRHDKTIQTQRLQLQISIMVSGH